MLQEWFLYVFFIYYVSSKDFKICLNGISKFFLFYFLGFLFVITLTLMLSLTPYTNEDIYVARQIFQFFIGIVFFSSIIKHLISKNPIILEKFFFLSLFILSIPSLISLIQYRNIFGLQDTIINIYKPFFGFNSWDIIRSYRTTSVFKDSYTFAVYMIVLDGIVFYYYIISSLSLRYRIMLLALFIFNYVIQLYVARTSLLFIPIVVLSIFIIIKNKSFFVKRYLFATLMFISVIIFGLMSLIGNEKYEWALKVLNIFSVSYESFSSVADMTRMNNLFLEFLRNHLSILFLPIHQYSVSYTEQTYYTDNFYFQEIVRYGLYGLFLYFPFHFFALKYTFNRNSILFILLFALVILNYKGGNTLFMTTNIYMYAFIIPFILSFENIIQNRISKTCGLRKSEKYV